MDLIAGLPGDTVAGFEHSLRQAIALNPENITVHTLTLKRASRIVIEDQKENDYADVAAMLEKCQLLRAAGRHIVKVDLNQTLRDPDRDHKNQPLLFSVPVPPQSAGYTLSDT